MSGKSLFLFNEMIKECGLGMNVTASPEGRFADSHLSSGELNIRCNVHISGYRKPPFFRSPVFYFR